jgi:DNA-binding SARP family transcriptional activator
MERIEVRLLGQLLVRRSDGSVVAPDEWRTTRTTDLLRLLALDAGQPVPTHVVIDRLWPNVDSERGRASLRTAASQLRKVLRVDCLERRAGALVLHGAWVDTQAYDGLVTRLDAARRAGEHAEVVALAQQAEVLYLGDVDAPDAPPQALSGTARCKQRCSVPWLDARQSRPRAPGGRARGV